MASASAPKCPTLCSSRIPLLPTNSRAYPAVACMQTQPWAVAGEAGSMRARAPEVVWVAPINLGRRMLMVASSSCGRPAEHQPTDDQCRAATLTWAAMPRPGHQRGCR